MRDFDSTSSRSGSRPFKNSGTLPQGEHSLTNALRELSKVNAAVDFLQMHARRSTRPPTKPCQQVFWLCLFLSKSPILWAFKFSLISPWNGREKVQHMCFLIWYFAEMKIQGKSAVWVVLILACGCLFSVLEWCLAPTRTRGRKEQQFGYGSALLKLRFAQLWNFLSVLWANGTEGKRTQYF